MAGENILKAIIQADGTQFKETIDATSNSLKSFAKATNDTNNSLKNSFAPAVNQAKVLQIGVSKLGDTIETLRAKALARRDLLNTERDVARIAILNKEIQELEAEVIRVQNIGKEGIKFDTSGVVKGANDAFSSLRRLAFILPGIGIAGIFDAAFTGLSKLVNAISASNFGVPKFKELVSSIEGAKNEFIEASVTVETLREEINLAKEGFISKDEVVKHYNETIGKTTGIVQSLDEAETALNKNANAYVQFTLLKAAANVALSKSAEVAFQAALQNQKDLERISKITADKEGIGEFIKSGEENLRVAEQESFSKRVTSLKDIANNFLKEAAEIKKSFNFNFFDDNKTEKVKTSLDEVERKTIQLAKEAEKVFNVPITLRFDDTDLDTTKIQKAVQVLQGIKDFTIKAKIDISLPDVKELPKETVERFFKDVPDALNDAVNKGLIDIPEDKKVTIGAEVSPFKKEIQDLINQFNRNGFNIPVTFDLKDADLVGTLQESLKGFEKAVDSVKKVSFSELLNQLEIVGAVGKEAGRQTEQAFLKAGKSTEEAAAAGRAIENTYKGISKGAADTAAIVGSTLVPAFTNLFDAILKGENPIKAFFNSIIQSIEQVVAKLIAAAVQAAILSAITGGASSFGSLFGKLLGFAEGGSTPSDKPYWVGEKGKELFFPGTSGFILSNQKSKALLTESVNQSTENKNAVYAHKITTIINNIDNSVKKWFYGTTNENGNSNYFSSSTVTNLDKIISAFSFRSTGGEVTHNKPFIVGEKRAELFVPKTDGFIIPFVQNRRFDESLIQTLNVNKSIAFRAGGGSVTAGNQFAVGEFGAEAFFPKLSNINPQSGGIINGQSQSVFIPKLVIEGNNLAIYFNQMIRNSIATTGKRPF